MKPKQINLTGIQALELIQKGHMVRRSCWVKDFYIRVCNEEGFGEDGNLICQKHEDEDITLYTHATSGYFMHIGYSSQPFARKHHSRDGEGIGMFFEKDWEDYGFISSEDFDKLTEKFKEKIYTENERSTILYD